MGRLYDSARPKPYKFEFLGPDRVLRVSQLGPQALVKSNASNFMDEHFK